VDADALARGRKELSHHHSDDAAIAEGLHFGRCIDLHHRVPPLHLPQTAMDGRPSKSEIAAVISVGLRWADVGE